jgi:Ca2+-transporting ATPase
VGIVDPPRPEVADAIARAHSAGVRVKMITGDHAATAAAIGRELGLAGSDRPLRAMSGAELDRLDDEALAEVVDEVDVFARVSPEHKLRLVHALQRRGEVVAMTGDGVNDAPALKRADMGIAMGITGTEVTKEAATMVLADDRFDTIIEAIERGRNIYDNIVKFVRFQLSTTMGFAVLFLLSSLLGIADGAPFTALAILWVNLIMDGPPAMALGVDPAHPDTMQRRPRPAREPILTRERWGATGLAAVVMALGTLAVLAWAPGPEAEAGTTTVAGTMAFTTFVLFQALNLMNVRNDRATALQRHSLANRWLWVSVATVLALQVLVTVWGPLQRLFDVTALTKAQWAVCVGVASTVLLAEEARKLVQHHRVLSTSTTPMES